MMSQCIVSWIGVESISNTHQTLLFISVLEINFLRVGIICYLVYKAVAKLTHLVANIGGRITTWLPSIVRSMTKQNSILSKA